MTAHRAVTFALMNIMSLAQGKPRFCQIDKDSWNMILGRAGKLPGPLAPEIIELAKKNNLEFYTGNPQDAYPDALPEYIKEMEENGWDRGEDDEELFELAMHDRQYRDYKSGLAKERFEKEVAQLRAEKNIAKAPASSSAPSSAAVTLTPNYITEKHANAIPVVASVSGQLLWELDFNSSVPPAPGREYKEGDTFCIIQASYALENVLVNKSGRLIDTPCGQKSKVDDTQAGLLYDMKRTANP